MKDVICSLLFAALVTIFFPSPWLFLVIFLALTGILHFSDRRTEQPVERIPRKAHSWAKRKDVHTAA